MSEPAPDPAGPRPAVRQAAFIFIFITVVLDMLALGMIVPVLPKLIVSFSAATRRGAAEITACSARRGRRCSSSSRRCSARCRIASAGGRSSCCRTSGSGLDYVLMALAPTLGWLFVGRVISGITAASFTTAGAYIADVTPPEKRAPASACSARRSASASSSGPAIGGVLGEIDPRLPFWVAGGAQPRQRGVRLVRAAGVAADASGARRSRGGAPTRSARCSCCARTRSCSGWRAVRVPQPLAHEVLPEHVRALHRLPLRLGASATVGLALAGVGVCTAIVQGGLVRPIVERTRRTRARCSSGLACGVIGFAVYGCGADRRLFLLGDADDGALGTLPGRRAQGLMTRRVEAERAGQLQGAHHSLRGIPG